MNGAKGAMLYVIGNVLADGQKSGFHVYGMLI